MTSPARRTRVKICGMTTPHDVELAVTAGADAVGIILAESPRRVAGERLADIVRAIPPFVDGIGVLANQSDEAAREARALGLTLQFSGHELPADCARQSAGRPYLKVFHIQPEAAYAPGDFEVLEEYRNALWMFDSAVRDQLGGTGVAFAWERVASVARRRPIVVSGGLTPDNVAACVRAVRPYAVDVRSGVESSGAKDVEKIRAFVGAVRESDAEA